MPDLLNTSLTGMLAFQRALEVTGHNIANANTPGYSRQAVELSTRIGDGGQQTYIGGGVRISVIERMYDALLVDQLRGAASAQSRFGALDSLAGRVDSLLADADTGLSTGLQGFFNAMQDVANDPGSLSIRQTLLGDAEGIAARFRALDDRLEGLEGEVNQRVSLAVDEINRLAEAVADVNDKIALAGVGAQPNDLLDQRDQLVLELSGLISVSTVMQDDGALNIFIGNGQSLVLGTKVQRLDVRASEFEASRLSVVYEGTAGTTPLDDSLSGGTLGGLLEFRTRMLDASRQALGQTAVTFANQLNGQHRQGMDLRGDLGGDLFTIAPPTILYSSQNTGTASVTTTVTDLGGFTGADYILQFDGAGYALTRADSGEVVTLSGSGTAADPFLADGLEIEVGAGFAAGDRVLIRTGHNAAGSIESAIGDPRALALASPTRAGASNANLGDATVSGTSIVDISDPSLLSAAFIEFRSATRYSINGAGNFPYVDGAPIIVNGTAVTITGVPAAGDLFTVEANYGGSGDNSNALEMADVQSTGVLDGGAISINQSYAQLVAGVGATTNQIRGRLEAQKVVFNNAQDAVLSTSGVNLDEEAANLIRYQQAYQAAAQVVSVTKTLFDSLLAATSR